MRTIKPLSGLKATLTLPGSKSYTHRVLIAASLAQGGSVLRNALKAEDTELTAQALARLGAGIDWQESAVRVLGTGGRLSPVAGPLYLGNSGTSMRFLTALVALGRGDYRLTGEDRLLERPVGELIEALGQFGVWARSENWDNYPPVIVRGGLTGGRATLSGSVSSQYLSALLFIAPLSEKGGEIEVTGELVSRPYVDLTLEVMGDFGISYYREGYRYFHLSGGQAYLAQDYVIEGDASGACYFWAAAALTGGRVTVTNISPDSSQGDVQFLGVLARMGCTVLRDEDGLSVQGGALTGVQVDLADMPDQVPTLAVLAAFAQGETTITGVPHLKYKESDRLNAVATELRKLGIAAHETEDGLVIQGGVPQAAAIDSHGDHRLAMSFAVAGLKTPGLSLRDPDVVAKSFPAFWDFWERIGEGG
jgi:3-phosphoshikimate 1-carboxyvinyltransferase